MIGKLRLNETFLSRNWSRFVRAAAFALALCLVAESSAIEKADYWQYTTDWPWGGTQWWTKRPPMNPGDGHLKTNWVNVAVKPDVGLDFEIDDPNAPATHADLKGVLGELNDTDVYDNGMTRLENTISGATLTLLEPPVAEDNASNSGGTITLDMAGHSLLINQGTYSYAEYDAANVLIGSGTVDFAATPLQLDITSGSAEFSSSLTGTLSLSVMSGMSPSYFGSEDVMLMFGFELEAQAVPEPTGLGVALMPFAAVVLARYRRRPTLNAPRV
jgi:hypothetical protein